MMNAPPDQDRRLILTLSDATWACIWAAVLAWVVAVISFGIYSILRCGAPQFIPQLMALDATSVAIIWMASLAMVKLTAFSFAVTAFALWTWKRRLLKRLHSEGTAG
jgi:hypothetical protein